MATTGVLEDKRWSFDDQIFRVGRKDIEKTWTLAMMLQSGVYVSFGHI